MAAPESSSVRHAQFHFYARPLKLTDLRLLLAVQEIVDALGMIGPTSSICGQFVGFGRGQRLDVFEVLREHRRHTRADVSNRERIEQSGKPARLTRLDARDQVLRPISGPSARARQLLLRQPIEIGEVADQALPTS